MVADHTRDDSLEAIARRLLADAPERFALTGLSMGGYVALAVMRLAPERVTRLVLLDTSARPDTEEARQRRLDQVAAARAGRFGAVLDALWQRLVHPARLQDPALKAVVYDMMREAGAEVFVRQQQAIMGRPDSRLLLRAIAAPTLVLVGDHDALTPPDLAREMTAFGHDGERRPFDAVGHLAGEVRRGQRVVIADQDERGNRDGPQEQA